MCKSRYTFEFLTDERNDSYLTRIQALCMSHSIETQLDIVVRKTKHVVFLDTPHTDLSWEMWGKMAEGFSGVSSRGQWKIWSAALAGSKRPFYEISKNFNVTSVNLGHNSTNCADLAHETILEFEASDHRHMSTLTRGSLNYERLAACIRTNWRLFIHDPQEIQRIRNWLGRRLDSSNNDRCQRNLSKQHPATSRWIFGETKFRKWATLETENPLLWLTGHDGCGKSVLCSLVAERLLKGTQWPAVVKLILSFDKPYSEYQLFSQLALQLLNHVLGCREGVDAEAFSIISRNSPGTQKLSRIHDLVRVLVSQCTTVFIFLDGLDEVDSLANSEDPQGKTKSKDVEQQLYSFVSFIVGLANSEVGNPLRLWCSSRRTPTVGKWISDLKAVELAVDRQAVENDIALYLGHEVENILGGMKDKSYQSELAEHLRKTARSNFLHASMSACWLRTINLSKQMSFKALISSIPRKPNEVYRERLKELLRSTPSANNASQGKPSPL